ncbi:MAG TPA: hypothetical protein VGP93_15725, partial [Polyangiaceae bacterium]|nr:hypothetical protein [Polyangiaceae bacterium]
DEQDQAIDLEGTRFATTELGALLDWYLEPEGGWHVQGAAGLYFLTVHRPNGDYSDDPSGLFFSLGGGYDWWVSSEASFGVLASATLAPLDVSEVASRTNVTVISPALLLTMTVN